MGEIITAWLASMGISKVSALFAFIGAALAAARKSEQSKVERVVNFVTGFGFALVMPGLIIKWFKLDADPTYFGALGFVFGYFGMAVMDEAMLIVKALRNVKWAEIVESWAKKGG